MSGRFRTAGWTVAAIVSVFVLAVASCGGGIPRVGILAGYEYHLPIVDGFIEGMESLGYHAGETVDYEVAATEYNPDDYRRVLSGFIDDDVDLIVSFPTEASLIAKEMAEGANIPVLFVNAFTDGTGLIQNSFKSGANLTGVRHPGPEIGLKRLDILHMFLPDARTFLVLYKRGYPSIDTQLKPLHIQADIFGIELIEVPAKDASELRDRLYTLGSSAAVAPDAVLTIAEPLSGSPDARTVLRDFADEFGIPYCGPMLNDAGKGPLFDVTVDLRQSGRLAASLAAKILQGMPAEDIPILTPEYIIKIDYRRLKRFGIEPSEQVLLQADEIFR